MASSKLSPFAPPFVSSQSVSAQTSAAPVVEPQPKKEYVPACRFFASQKGCHAGDQCRFRHITNTHRPVQARPPAQSIPQVFKPPVEHDAPAATHPRTIAKSRPSRTFKQMQDSSSSSASASASASSSASTSSSANLIAAPAPTPTPVATLTSPEQPNVSETRPTEVVVSVSEGPKQLKSRRAVPKPAKMASLTKGSLKGASLDRLRELQQNELRQIKRKFGKAYAVIEDTPCFVIQIALAPSDPDFPYELTHLLLQMKLPPRYPCDPVEVRVINHSDTLPAAMVQRVEEQIAKSAKSRRYQLMIRSLLLWIDRSMEELLAPITTSSVMTQPAPSLPAPTQLVFISNQPRSDNPEPDRSDDVINLPEKFAAEDPSQLVAIALPRKNKTSVSVKYEPASSASDNDDDEEEAIDDDKNDVGGEMRHPLLEAAHRGIQIRIVSPTVKGISYGTCTKLNLMTKCDRCHHEAEVELLPSREKGSPCTRCNQPHLWRFRPAIWHENSNCLGYLDTSNVIPADYLPSSIQVHCYECDLPQTIDCVSTGNDIIDRVCFRCHKRLTFSFGTISFFKLPTGPMPFAASTANQASLRTRHEKEIGFVVGQALPNRGTCHHYSRSKRMFRFPCCGKAFPCDICHEEAVEGQHLSETATRMICGFCSLEQPLNKQAVCSGCHHDLVGHRSSFWEGGDGCRDTSKMARKETRKTKGVAKVSSKKLSRVGVAGKERVARAASALKS